MRKVELSQVYFIITRTCNLFCSHCIRSSGPKVKDTVTLEQAYYALDEINRIHQQPNILISGGEPTIHPQFLDILGYACRLFKQVTINTNGLNYIVLANALKRHSNIMIQISIDGDEKTHNIIRGKNTFIKTMENVKKLAELGANIVIATTVGKSNIDTIKNLDIQLECVPFKLWTIQREVIYGRAAKSNALTTQHWNDFVVTTENFINKERIKSTSMFNLQSFAPDDQVVDVTKCNCSTGRSKLYINPDLTTFSCACLEEFSVGDLKSESIEQVLSNMGQLKIEPDEFSPCVKCPAFSKCRGGCPGASYHTYGAFGIGDPRCPAIQDLVGEG